MCPLIYSSLMIYIGRQRCQSIVFNSVYRWTVSVASLMWVTMPIVSQRCQSVAVYNFHWHTFFRGYCSSGNVLFPVFCPGYRHILPYLSHDANGQLPKKVKIYCCWHCLSIDSVWPVYCGRQWPWARTFPGSCSGVAAMIYISLIRTQQCNRSGTTINNTEYQPQQHRRQCNTLDPHDAHCLVETHNVAVLLHAMPCTHIAAQHDTPCTHSILVVITRWK